MYLCTFPLLPLFLKNEDFAKVNDSSSSESEVNTSLDGPGRSSDCGNRKLPHRIFFFYRGCPDQFVGNSGL